MAATLVPVLFKPGIQRDGTPFQGDYCTDGQWVRFQRGVPKKIGGLLGLNVSFTTVPATTIISSIFLLSSNNDGNKIGYLAKDEGGVNDTRIYKLVIAPNHLVTQAPIPITGILANRPNLIWQIEPIIINSARHILCFGANNGQNIAQNSPPIAYSGLIEPPDINTQLTIVAPNFNALANGGFCFSNPYLFVYGSNGYVAWSRNNNPLNFVPDQAFGGGSFIISSDKVIWGRPIRGGTNAPTILFWTLSSVVRITNVGDQTVQFKIDVISNSSSILSSRCVVEYDGLFFWCGTDRFFVYNGIVQVMDNTMNINYIFDNLNLEDRQKVFGVKKPKYNEIWWYFPDNKVIIYNIKLNAWSDATHTAICGTYFVDDGKTYTYGLALTNPDAYNHLWKHEVGTDQVWYPQITAARTITPITSFFTTPIFSWAAFNPTRGGMGPRGQLLDKWVDIRRIEPDFVMDNDEGLIRLTINMQTYAQSPIVSSFPTINFTRTTEKLDLRFQARQFSLTFTSTANFEMGNLTLLLGIGDGQ